MSPSRKSETSSPSSSPKLAHDSGRVRKRTGSFGYRRGRPSTAARVWQSPRMKRNLVRLYYCTTLRTTVIGKILSALASIKYGSSLNSGQRSTQVELQRLLSSETARPRTRDIARERVASYRIVRNRQRVSTRHQTSRPTNAQQTLSNDLWSPQDEPSIGLPHFAVTPPSQYNSAHSTLSETAVRGSAAGETPSIKGTRLLQTSVRSLSSRSRPSSSLLAEIRSLLSFSTDSTRSGRPSLNAQSLAGSIMSDTPGSMVYTNLVVEVCCGRRSECLHRKVVTAMTDITGEPLQLPRVEFGPRDFRFESGRTTLNETALHIAARWRDDIKFLCNLVQRCADDLLNVKDHTGQTFMHLLNPTTLAGNVRFLFRILQDKKFRWTQGDSAGDNCLAALVANDAAIQGLGFRERMDFVSGFQDILQMISEQNQSVPLAALMMPTSTGELTGRRIAQSFQRQALWHMERGYVEATSISELANRYSQIMDDALSAEVSSDPSLAQTSFHAWLTARDVSNSPSISRPVSFDDPNTYNERGETCPMALIRAVGGGRLSEEVGMAWLENLLWRRADVRLIDLKGNTALHHATYWCLPRFVEAFLQHGADPQTRNSANETALDICVKRNSAARTDETGVEYSKSLRVLVRLFDGPSIKQRQVSNRKRTRVMSMLKSPFPPPTVYEQGLLEYGPAIDLD